MSKLSRFELRLLGGATLLVADGGALAGRAVHRHRVALLALLALARPGGLSREKLIGLLWPERDATAARHLLRAAVHELRHALGAAAIEGIGDDLHLDTGRVRVDVDAFEEALVSGELERAVGLYRGPFLDGLFLDDAEAFEQWVTAQRARLARRYEDAVETLAERAGRDGDATRAAQWWRALAGARPGDGRVALRTMEALAAAGDRAGALSVADAHGVLLRTEYGVVPEEALLACADRLRAGGSAAVSDGETGAVVTPDSRVAAGGNASVGNDAVVSAPTTVTPAPAGGVTTATFPASTLPPHGAPAGSGTREPVSPLTNSPTRRRVASALLVAAAATALAWNLRPHPRPAAPDLLAVVPFDVVAGAPGELRDGLPELLSANLDQVTGLRTMPARLSAARSAALGGSATPGRMAQALGSDAIVTGVVAPAPGGVRVVATLVDGRDSTLARVAAAGAVTDLPALVDRITVGLLREIWGRRWGVPQPRLAAVSTTSPGALRAYLRGETFLRQALWDSAASALAQAVDLDSTFALAHFRLAEPYGWRYGMASAPAERALAAARRFADRLPPRERALLSLRVLHEAGDLRAVDSSAALAERYPDDPEAQYVRADVRFHARTVHGARFTGLAAASFDTAARLDSNAARVWAHPIALALWVGDRARFDHAVARLTALTPGSHVQVPERPDYALLRAIRWAAPREAARLLLERLRATGSGGPPPAWTLDDLLLAAEQACVAGERPDASPLPAVYDAVAAAYPGDASIAPGLAMRRLRMLLATGQLEAARPWLERAWAADPRSTPVLALLPAALGFAPRAWTVDVAARAARAEALEREPTYGRRVVAYWRGVSAIAAGDVASGRTALRAAVAPDAAGVTADSVPRALAGAARAAAGWARLVEGDTAAGLAELTAGLREAGYGGEGVLLGRPLRSLRTRLLATGGERRAEGIDLVRGELLADGTGWAWWHRTLAAALDAEGDRAGAAAERARFAVLWTGAVPSGGARR